MYSPDVLGRSFRFSRDRLDLHERFVPSTQRHFGHKMPRPSCLAEAGQPDTCTYSAAFFPQALAKSGLIESPSRPRSVRRNSTSLDCLPLGIRRQPPIQRYIPARVSPHSFISKEAPFPFPPRGKPGWGRGSPHAAKTMRLPPTRGVSKHSAETPLIIPRTANPRCDGMER
jgi:hypothetical protein